MNKVIDINPHPPLIGRNIFTKMNQTSSSLPSPRILAGFSSTSVGTFFSSSSIGCSLSFCKASNSAFVDACIQKYATLYFNYKRNEHLLTPRHKDLTLHTTETKNCIGILRKFAFFWKTFSQGFAFKIQIYALPSILPMILPRLRF